MDPDLIWSRGIRSTTGCLEWQRCRSKRGYGQTWRDGKLVYVHRLAWSLVNGPIPVGLEIMHHCDNPSCFEPAHLASVSHLQNMRDMKIKGRGPTGERIAQSKLTKGDVVAIRAAYSAGGVSQGSLAAAFGVSPSEVSLIVRHRRWAA